MPLTRSKARVLKSAATSCMYAARLSLNVWVLIGKGVCATIWPRRMAGYVPRWCSRSFRASGTTQAVEDSMTTAPQFDAIVVGAGPAGCSAALAMARAGLHVALIERGEYAGAKNVSGAALYAPGLLADLLPNYGEEAPVERFLTRRVISLLAQAS